MPAHFTNIPRDINGFNNFINVTCAYLVLGSPVTNAVRFGWTAANLLFWQGIQTAWTPKYLLYINKKASFTTNIKDDLLNIIAEAVAYDNKNKLILKVRATVDLTTEDCSTFNLPPKLSTIATGAHSPLEQIHEVGKTLIFKEPVYPRLIPLAGGFLKIEGHTSKEKSGRAHKPEGFDLLEYAVAVFYSGTDNLPKLATDARLLIGHSTKASFVLQTANMTSNLPTIQSDAVIPLKLAVLFFRWAKSKYPNLDGPWSGPFTTPLL